MLLTKLKTGSAALLALALLGAGIGAFLYRAPAGEPARAAAPAADEDGVLVKVPSPCDGVLLVVGTDVKGGEEVAPGRAVTIKVGGETKKYRRLREGDRVEEGQLLALLDGRLAREQMAIKQAEVEAAESEHRAALKTKEEAEKRYEAMKRLREAAPPRAVSDDDFRAARLTWDRFTEEAKAKAALVRQAREELSLDRTLLQMHEIRSSVAGVIRAVYRRRGEGVRKFEPVFLIRTKEKVSRPARGPAEDRNRVRVPARCEGTLLFTGTEVKPGARVPPEKVVQAEVPFLAVEAAPGEKISPGQRVILAPGDDRVYRRWKPGDPLEPGEIALTRQRQEFRKLEVGDPVKEGQLLALVNPALTVHEVAIKIARLEACAADHQAAVKTREEAEKRYEYRKRQRDIAPRSVSDEDFRDARMVWDRYAQEEITKAARVRQARRELRAALTALERCEVRSGVRGVIRAVRKHRGEAVRNLETVVELDVADGEAGR
jgi:multidrug efflux pump subunit AcrA (membrane-fusion protein)